MFDLSDLGVCDCCELNPAVGVASVPGLPMTIVWCQSCVDAGVIPLWAAIANTGMVGGYDNSADWWKQIVDRTLEYFEKTRSWFDEEVEKSEREMTEQLFDDLTDAETDAEDGPWPPTS